MVEIVRVDGEPCQRHIAFLGSYRRARLSAAVGAFGSGVGSEAASNFPSAARSGSSRGAGGESVVFNGAPDCRCYRGELVVGEVNCRHGPDIIGRNLFSKEV